MNISAFLPGAGKRPVFLDGGFGTMLQARGLEAGAAPEDWNVTRPDQVLAIHREYLDAGAEIICTNTFGANPLKYHGKRRLSEVISAGVALARKAVDGKGLVALDIGPSGRLLQPSGDLGFERAYDAFASSVKTGAEAGADIVIIETMGDTMELKAAVLAAKENCRLPVFASVALGENGKLLTGGDVECVATLLDSLGVDAMGFNCGLGPDRLLEHVQRLAELTDMPIIAKANAGMPEIVDGKTVFTVTPEVFAAHAVRLASAGAAIIGGCCGTTPAHIAAVKQALTGAVTIPRKITPRTVVSGGCGTVELVSGGGLIIGERINPTGKKRLQEAYRNGDTAHVLREAVGQTEAGAVILDVNCGVPGIDEAATLDATVSAVQAVVTVPLQIDTADPNALERALRHVNGKALVNSVNGKRESMDAVFPLVKKYGGTVVALCLDENGIPATADGRIAIARRILAEGEKYGLSAHDFVFDALTLAVSADAQAAQVTLETVKRLTGELKVNTVLGVSNVSFGLPDRGALNNAMYALAKRAGLSAAIANPSVIADQADSDACDVLLGRDPGCAKWIATHKRDTPSVTPPDAANASGDGCAALRLAVKRGLKHDARAEAENLVRNGTDAMSVIQQGIVPALEDVGGGFEAGKVYLPQLLMAADAAGAAFEPVKSAMSAGRGNARADGRRPVVIATVKGDIHDIGKNIVRALLENYGFDVIDLGRDVPPETIVDAATRSGAMMVGLSALMTTTVSAMAETVSLLKSSGLDCRTCVGGAVVTREYAEAIGADFYAKDAMRTVRFAESLTNGSTGKEVMVK